MKLALCVVLFCAISLPANLDAAQLTFILDFTLLEGTGTPLQTVFTYDTDTDLFSNLVIRWPSIAGLVVFDFLFDCPTCIPEVSLNAFPIEFRRTYLADLMN